MDDFGTTIRVMLNSLAFFLLLLLAGYVAKYNVLWGALVVLSAFDQFEDVYFYVTKNRLLPTWFTPIDIVLEGVLAITGTCMLVFGLIYWYAFKGWLFFLWVVISAAITWSAAEDIVDDIHILVEKFATSTPATVFAKQPFRFYRRR